MIIRQLNSLFYRHSRWLFGIITVIIVITFVWMFTPGQTGCDFIGSGNAAVGTAYGEKITVNDINEQRQCIGAVEALAGYRGRSDFDAEQIFYTCCLFRALRNIGIDASDAEVSAFIRNLPALRENGKFSPEKYRALRDAVSASGYDGDMLLEGIRRTLITDKTGALFKPVITPGEIKALYRLIGGSFDYSVAEFKPDSYRAGVNPDDEQLKAYFSAGKYTVPGKISGILLKFSGDDAAVAAQKFASSAYDSVSVLPPEKVKAQITVMARGAGCGFTEFKNIEFEASAIGEVKSAELVRGMVSAAAGNPVAAPVKVGEDVYVGIALESVEPHPAAYEEVSDKVRKDYISAEAGRLALADAGGQLEKFNQAENKTEAFKTLGGIHRDFSFSPLDDPPPSDLVIAMALRSGAGLAAGGDAVLFPGGIVWLRSRNFSDAGDVPEKYQERLKQLMMNHKFAAGQQAFYENMNASCAIREEFRSRKH